MIRSLGLAPLLTTALLAPVCLGSPALAAQAAQAHPPAPLSTHLHYRTVSWYGTAGDPDSGGVSVRAPRHWSFTLTADEQGRFNDPTHTFLLTARLPEHTGTLRSVMAREVRRLQGTRDLKILQRSVHGPVHYVLTGTLTYRYTDADGQARWVSYDYEGSRGNPVDRIVSVAGRPRDAAGLRVLRNHVYRTMEVAG